MSRIAPRSRTLAVLSLLGVLLGATAPLAHVHLDAAGLAASGLCGEHHGDAAPDGLEHCSLCLAGAQGRAVPAENASLEAPIRRTRPALAALAPTRPAEPGLEASRPRAPPRV